MKITAQANYVHGTRYLRLNFNGIHAQVHWQGTSGNGQPWAVFRWFDPLWSVFRWYDPLYGRAVHTIPSGETRWCRLILNFYEEKAEAAGQKGAVFPPWPRACWSDFLQIARFVAAGKTSPILLLGWLEDNAPEPWSKLASPEPIECFRALSPLPLSE